MTRPRTPTATLHLTGTFRPDRHGDRDAEPHADGEPEMPDWLDAPAAEMWQRVVPRLTAMGIARAVDADALVGMCRWWAVWRAADAKLQAGDGDSYKLAIEATISWKQFAAAASRFGLTPADRSKLAAESNDGEGERDPLQEMMKARQARG